MKNEYDPLEKLSLLAAHAIDWKHIPSDFKRLKPEDVAAKLSKLHRGASLLGRVKVAGQVEFVPDLIRALRTETIRRRIPWPTRKKTMLHKLASLALAEVIDPRICRACNGVGYSPEVDNEGKPTGKPRSCENCGGGRYCYSDYSRYQFCGVHQEEWRRWWNRPYLEILTIAWLWEGEARDALT